MATTLMTDTCPYNSQKLLFISSIRGSVGNIWVRGRKVQSAYFSPQTVPIFRSESARYVLFVQMSREMWHFDTDDGGDGDQGEGGGGGVGGEIVFNKLINGFLPELFKRWKRINAHHLVSIVLFTRVVYEDGEPVGILNRNGKESEEFLGTPGGINIGEGRRYRDFYRVVVSSMASSDWTIILHRLKKEFSVFLRDILVLPITDDEFPLESNQTTPISSAADSMASRPGTPSVPTFVDMLRPASSSTSSQPSPRIPPHKSVPSGQRKKQPRMIITGRPSAAIHGNILEAINLATLQFSKDYVDRDLVRTGISVVIITPGTGHFEVDYDMLKATTEGLIMTGMGVDLVCLSKVPLHTVPLFKYRSPIPISVLAKQEQGSPKIFPRGLSPPKVTITPSGAMAPDRSQGEWVYAVPHWIDISFWSAASEKKINKRGRVEKKKEKKKSAGGFRARAKMYELQMMGIMENEISEISIPFLHDNPFWKPLPTEEEQAQADGSSTKGSVKPGTTTSTTTPSKFLKEAFKWMDEYDGAAFRPLPVLKARERAALDRRIDGEDAEKIEKTLEEVDPLVLGTSFHGEAPGRQVSLPGGAFFDRKMKERRPELESPIELREEIPNTSVTDTPSAAPPSSGLPKPSRLGLVRNISFPFKSWGAAKATAKTGIVSTEATAIAAVSPSPGSSGVMVTRGFDTSEVVTPKSPLSPRTTHLEESPTTGTSGSLRSPEKLGWGSRPISIKNNAITSLEAAGRDRDRRRSVVGSPLDRASLIRERESVDILKVASLTRHGRPSIDLVANAEKTATIPPTVSPTSALSPWVQVLNPSNPKKNTPSAVNQFRRWHHVFPKPIKISTVKWKSLCSPAALPLTTEHFPSAEQLRDEYQENPYVISQNADYDEIEESSSSNREELVRAMISQRLAQGFQIVVGSSVAEATAGRGGDPDIYSKTYMVKAGSSCFMSLGSQIHQLICDEEYNVEVKRYVRKPTTAIGASKFTIADEYVSYTKTVTSEGYIPVKIAFRSPIAEYNWNYVDQYIGGYEDTLTEQLRYWRARFVLIPNDPPESARRGGLLGHSNGGELNDEEIRLEGIRRLTQVFQRNRYIPPEERQYEKYGRRKAKEKNPLQILYKTVDPSVVVAQELESLPLIEDPTNNMRRSQLLTTEMFEKKNLDLKAIAQELQGPKGVRLQDRRWHLRFHSNCFIGEDMVTWIVENFKDVETRQEAEEIGLKLFKAGLFQHVDKRHQFRDGNYFYRIAEAHANTPRPTSKGGWFGGFKSDKPAQSTPAFDMSSSPLRSRSSTMATDEGSETSSTSGYRTPTPTPATKKKVEVELSKVMKYDIDPSRKSYRKELINLHYDRLHNPDNCYHIRIDWMNTTAKLIEDQLASWARTVDRYGLKLVEAPIDEVSTIPHTYPFRSPYIFKFCLPPPPPPQTLSTVSPTTESMDLSTILSPTQPAPLLHHSHNQNDSHFYHRLALRKLGFVLDTEAAKNFPPTVSVKYSWGAPSYRHSQYIHRSGVIFCQITDEGSFLLMANRQYTIRTAMLYPPPAVALGSGTDVTPETVKDEIESFCKDPEALRRFYDEVNGRVGGGAAVGPGSVIGGSSMGILGSPVIGPVGAGSPTMGTSVVHAHGVGRTTSMKSGRNSIVDLVPEDFVLGRGGYEPGPGR